MKGVYLSVGFILHFRGIARRFREASTAREDDDEGSMEVQPVSINTHASFTLKLPRKSLPPFRVGLRLRFISLLVMFCVARIM